MTDSMLTGASVAIVGLGLMGASLGYDLRGHCRRVVGVARRAEVAAAALAAGCVDEATTDARAAAPEADLLILATPARTILRQIAELGPLLRPGGVVIDLGSTKSEICRALDALPPHVQAVGGHPMCGKETAGLEAAEPGLYRGCTFILSPLPRTTPETLALAAELISHIGAHQLVLDPIRHDRLVAAISHLPYLAACTLVSHVMAVAETDATVWDVAASGFRDSTRIAASEITMLLDILLTNRASVLAAVDDFQVRLAGLRQNLEQMDEVGLRQTLEQVAAARREWGRRRLAVSS